eukprot:364912-Chlamydomonas_euryale.AAC.1
MYTARPPPLPCPPSFVAYTRANQCATHPDDPAAVHDWLVGGLLATAPTRPLLPCSSPCPHPHPPTTNPGDLAAVLEYLATGSDGVVGGVHHGVCVRSRSGITVSSVTPLFIAAQRGCRKVWEVWGCGREASGYCVPPNSSPTAKWGGVGAGGRGQAVVCRPTARLMCRLCRRHACRQADGQTGRQAGRQAGSKTERQTHGCMRTVLHKCSRPLTPYGWPLGVRLRCCAAYGAVPPTVLCRQRCCAANGAVPAPDWLLSPRALHSLTHPPTQPRTHPPKHARPPMHSLLVGDRTQVCRLLVDNGADPMRPAYCGTRLCTPVQCGARPVECTQTRLASCSVFGVDMLACMHWNAWHGMDMTGAWYGSDGGLVWTWRGHGMDVTGVWHGRDGGLAWT